MPPLQLHLRTSQDFAQNPLTRTAQLYYHQRCTHIWSQIDGSGQLLSQHLARGTRTNTLTAITGKFKVTDAIGGRVGRYNFSPTLILFGSTRRQCPLHLVNSKSSLLGCERSACRRLGWSLRMFQTQQHEPHGSTRVVEGQPDGRGRATRQSLFIARDRLRCEPGSKPVIVTNALTSVEGHVPSRGDKGRRRKIFVGCPAIRPIWDQSPGIRNPRLETVGNRLYPLHDQDCLRRFTAEAQIQDRSRAKTGPNTAPGFLRVCSSFPRRREPRVQPVGAVREPPLIRHPRAGGNPEKNKARHLPLSRRREPRAKQSTPPIPHTHPPLSRSEGGPSDRYKRSDRGGCPRRSRGGGNPEKNKARRLTPTTIIPSPSRPPSFPRTPPSFPRRREPRGG